MKSRESRETAAAAIAQHGMVHDGVVDFMEGPDALAAAQKLTKPKAQKVAKQKRPLKQDVSKPHGQAKGKLEAKLRVAAPMRKRT